MRSTKHGRVVISASTAGAIRETCELNIDGRWRGIAMLARIGLVAAAKEERERAKQQAHIERVKEHYAHSPATRYQIPLIFLACAHLPESKSA